MTYAFNLTDVNGNRYSWNIADHDIVCDRNRVVLAFTARFNDGSVRTFALGNHGSFVQKLLSTKLDELGGAATGAMVGRRYGLIGTALGSAAGWIATEILENVILHSADYYDERGNRSFHGRITL